ncbi:MAG: hypothetical protein K2X77_16460 [Candidatus Obscuribacterales bacterium]|nr:hypothetical protein [Candidatus Obscuribacterales bacterium]
MSRSANTVERESTVDEAVLSSALAQYNRSERKPEPERTSSIGFLAISAIFAAAFAVRWIYNFYFEHTNNFASCDAFEYIQNAQLLLDMKNFSAAFWSAAGSCLTGQASSADWNLVRSTLAPMKDFYISGPVFPAFLTITAIVGGLGSNIAQANQSITGIWPALLTGNVFVSALTCVMIAAIANESFGKKCGILAGWMAVFYPAFIVNSGRLYSETFATCLLTALTYLAIRGFRKGGNSLPLVFMSGFLAAALQLTRSIMVAVSLILVPLTVLQKYGKENFSAKAAARALCWLLPMFVGFSLVAIPWLGFQKLAFGTGGLVVDRVGRYNFFIGNNIDIQGWLSYPYPDGRGVESRSFPDLAVSAVKKNPVRWARLMLDKPLRLFKYPWNDFRTAIGPFTFHSQVLYHQLVVIFGLLGVACTAFTCFGKALARRELFCRTFLFGLLAFHCVYFSFITVPRYNLSSIPEFIIFAAAALTLLAGLLSQVRWRGLAATILLSTLSLFVVTQIDCTPLFEMISKLTDDWTFQMSWGLEALSRTIILLFLGTLVYQLIGKMQGHKTASRLVTVLGVVALLPLFVIPERANGRMGEWFENLSAGRSIKQVLLLNRSDSQLQAGQSIYLLIDSLGVKQPSDGLSVKVNGHELTGPFLPSLCFAESYDRFLENSPGHVEREGERMWSSLSYSANIANLDQRQWMMVRIPESILNESAKIAESKGADLMPLKVELANNSSEPIRVYGNAALSKKEQMIPSVSDYSWEKAFYGVENPSGLTDTRYDIKVPVAGRQVSNRDLSSEVGMQRGAFNCALLVTPPPVRSTSATGDQAITVPREIVASAGKPITIISDLTNHINIDKDNTQKLWIMSVRGKSTLLNGSGGFPRVTASFKYKKPDGSTFSYDPPWGPLYLRNADSGKGVFELVLPTKPVIDGAIVEGVSITFAVQPKGPSYSNLSRSAEGTSIQFTELDVQLVELPNNPLGIGLKVL